MEGPIDLIPWHQSPTLSKPLQSSLGRQIVDRGLEIGQDIVNPIHHIPFVGHLYRAISGDEIAPEASITGGFLYGGPLGALGGVASILFDRIIDDGNDDQTAVALASNDGGDAPRHPRIDFTDPWRFNE